MVVLRWIFYDRLNYKDFLFLRDLGKSMNKGNSIKTLLGCNTKYAYDFQRMRFKKNLIS